MAASDDDTWGLQLTIGTRDRMVNDVAIHDSSLILDTILAMIDVAIHDSSLILDTILL